MPPPFGDLDLPLGNGAPMREVPSDPAPRPTQVAGNRAVFEEAHRLLAAGPLQVNGHRYALQDVRVRPTKRRLRVVSRDGRWFEAPGRPLGHMRPLRRFARDRDREGLIADLPALRQAAAARSARGRDGSGLT
jgi:hypothetical protein